MQARAIRALGLCVGGLLAFWAAAPVSAQYSKGFEWNRGSDWMPGAEQGSPQNNPGPDAAGNPVWSYEMAHGGPLGSETPWYEGPSSLLTWDDAWWDSGQGAWSEGDDVNPPVFANRLTHNLGEANIDNVPMVRWHNPVGDGATLDMAGTLRILWTGAEFVGAPTDVDVVVAMFDASTQTTNLLMETTVSKPHDELSVGDDVDVPVLLSGISLDEGDSIIVSARGRDVLPGHWIDIHDGGMTMTLVPGPGAAGLLAVAGLFGTRRRRG